MAKHKTALSYPKISSKKGVVLSDSGLGFSHFRFILLIVVIAISILLFELVSDFGGGLIKSQVKRTTSKFSQKDNTAPVFVLTQKENQPVNIEKKKSLPPPVMSELSGEEVYNSACIACHMTGAGGAPLLGDTDAWETRVAQGKPLLVERAVEGYMGELGIMPAKGGRLDLSDEEVENAVTYMLEQL